MNGWARGERIALYSLVVAIIGVLVALLTVPEFRYMIGLKREAPESLEHRTPQISSPSNTLTKSPTQTPEHGKQLSISSPTTTKPNCIISYSAGSCWTLEPPHAAPCSGLPAVPASVTIVPDGSTCTLTIPAGNAQGVRTEDASGRQFLLREGEGFDVIAKGQISFSSEHPCVGPEGLYGWYDPHVDSPFTQNVGGLEFSIGALQDNRHFAGNYYKGMADSTGILVFRVIDRLTRNDKLGAFTVTVRKLQ
jgi:hypothetical protein